MNVTGRKLMVQVLMPGHVTSAVQDADNFHSVGRRAVIDHVETDRKAADVVAKLDASLSDFGLVSIRLTAVADSFEELVGSRWIVGRNVGPDSSDVIRGLLGNMDCRHQD
jgi:hypothetical protein